MQTASWVVHFLPWETLVKTIVPAKGLPKFLENLWLSNTWTIDLQINAGNLLSKIKSLGEILKPVTIMNLGPMANIKKVYLNITCLNHVQNIQPERKQNPYQQLQLVRTNPVSLCLYAFITLLLNYTWMGIRMKGDVPEEQSWTCLFFSSQNFQFFNPIFVRCAHVRAVFCHFFHFPPLTPTHIKLTQEKGRTVLLKSYLSFVRSIFFSYRNNNFFLF